MTIYYRSVRYIDGKLRTVIADENNNIIKNPTKEQKELAIFDDRRKNERAKCCRCGGGTWINPDGRHVWNKCRCDKPNCTTYLCHKCKAKDYDKERRVTAWRTGNLSMYSNTGKGFIGAQIVAKTYGLDDCNVKMNNFNFYVDLSKHSTYGNIEVKTASLSVEYMRWMVALNNFNFDTLIIVCMDCESPWKDVLRVYVIPCENVIGLQGIYIPARGPIDELGRSSKGSKWDKFRIDEKPFNDTYHKMDINKCKVLRKDE